MRSWVTAGSGGGTLIDHHFDILGQDNAFGNPPTGNFPMTKVNLESWWTIITGRRLFKTVFKD
jgi:hypothetical protein